MSPPRLRDRIWPLNKTKPLINRMMMIDRPRGKIIHKIHSPGNPLWPVCMWSNPWLLGGSCSVDNLLPGGTLDGYCGFVDNLLPGETLDGYSCSGDKLLPGR